MSFKAILTIFIYLESSNLENSNDISIIYIALKLVKLGKTWRTRRVTGWVTGCPF